MSLRRLRPDNFTLILLGTVLLASLLPCRGQTARIYDGATDGAIAPLFFLHGARLPLLGLTDQGTILLVVYTAFSAAVVGGLWRDTPISALLSTLAACALLLALVMLTLTWAARRLGFLREDEVTIVFCGSKKSMASGIPMAKILFAGQLGGLGALVLPLMIFHQLQLMVRAVVARHYAARGSAPATQDDREADRRYSQRP
ncbi:hypothetical protein EAH75_17840 [Rhodanobacter glycinis]|uniref:Bile acid:sodium symporter n=1 Tax=Rhodanobacter glycinis TaxID=582702 RepID=A0A502C018_9GAMM|nr:bile acid:sodium symporter [Rhodanobacter glycinis]TPG06497.1 hypothetical protein EAH88_14335 [Rhodanobacter glycinis]TPG45928.1 hypothetical protein EAH75_17840 [Rhodanobacter glycinis]